MSVYELTRNQLDELKTAYFYQDEVQDILSENIVYPEQIPDDIIFNHYDGIEFVDEDFFC